MPTGVVLLAAGVGRRFGGKKPKQLSLLSGEPLFCKSLRTFLKIPSIKEIVLVVPPRKEKFFGQVISKLRLAKTVCVVRGGRFRGESVKFGVKELSPKATIILVHDSARPLVSKEVIARVEKAAARFGVALAAWPLPDTLKVGNSRSQVQKTIPRKNLWLAQTPQGFNRKAAMECLLKPNPQTTDDVELAEKKGYKVRLVKGQGENIKITYPADFDLVKALLKRGKK